MKRIALLPSVVVLALCWVGDDARAQTDDEVTEMAEVSYQYGFRYDPMEWVESSASLDAALVRQRIFAAPNPGDEALLQKRIDEILAAQNEDGTLSDDPRHRYQFTCDALNQLADLGVDPDRDEVKRAVEVVLREKDEESADPIGIYTVRALCRLGMGDHPEVKAGLEHLVAREDEWNGPWGRLPVDAHRTPADALARTRSPGLDRAHRQRADLDRD